jgi:site-specific recombinase XerD
MTDSFPVPLPTPLKENDPEESLLPTPFLEEEIHQAKAFAKDQHAKATRRAYDADIRLFTSWCQDRGFTPFPALPQTVSVFLSWGASQGAAVSTLERRAAALRYGHQIAGYESPTQSELVKATLKGIRRTLGVAPVQKVAVTVDRLQDILKHVPDTLQGKRDKAILLLGFAGAFRRSELVALTVNDLIETDQGVRVLIRKSKTDQEGEGQEIALYQGKLRVVDAIASWREAASITHGFLFRPLKKGGKVLDQPLAAESVADIVKKYAGCAGFVPQEYAGHSLRAGFLTSAAENGASLFKMMEVSRHKSVDTLKGYIRRADLFKDHAGKAFL